MATDGQVQLPPGSTGHALRTVEVNPSTTAVGGDDGLLHQQVVTLADGSGNVVGTANTPPIPVMEDSDSEVITLLERILVEMKRQTFILAVLADNYVLEDVDLEDI